MGSRSKAVNYKNYKKNTGRHTNIEKWRKMLDAPSQKSPEFVHQIERNMKGDN